MTAGPARARRLRGLTIAAVAGLLALGAGERAAGAGPAEPPPALFALIVGVNASPDPNLPPLKYADDDAARYLDLFRALGARTTILSRLDDNTRQLHPQAAAEAIPPRRAELTAAVGALGRDVARARAGGVRSVLYVVYAGHGDVHDAGFSLTLEDGALGQAELLAQVVDAIGADRSHLIVDACHAYLLALPRGPGGTRRALRGFVELEAAARAGRIGLLLSSSTSGETHEWAGFEAGVFSHEVRSGLYGAADADGDGLVTYAEMGAFIARANETIANERFRPQVLARPPRDGDPLLDLRARRDQELRLDGADSAAHYLLEDGRGVRLLDFHGSEIAPVHLVKPPGDGPLYLRRLPDGAERTIPRTDGVVRLGELPVAPARAQSRGAAHQAFTQIFEQAFDGTAVDAWTQHSADAQIRFDRADRARDAEERDARLRRYAGFGAFGLGAAAAIAAGAFELSARGLRNDAPAGESQADAIMRNDQINARNRWAGGLALGAAGMAATGALLLFWPPPRGAPPALEIATSGAAQVRIDASERRREDDDRRAHTRRMLGATVLAAGTAAIVAAGAVELSAQSLRDGALPGESQARAAQRNDTIALRNHIALGLAIGGAASAVGGALLLWRAPQAAPAIEVAASPQGALIGARWRL